MCDDRRLVAGVGPAGTGKTTAMRLVAAALAADGRRLVAVAPSARAAAVLHRELGVPATTLAKLLHAHAADPPGPVPDGLHLAAGDVVLVDEAGMAGTPALGRLLTLAERTGALVRLLGDPMQLSAVEAGGALRLLTADGSANELQRVHRFSNPDEVRASLGLRQGHTSALGFYEAQRATVRRQPAGHARGAVRRVAGRLGRRPVHPDGGLVDQAGRGALGAGPRRPGRRRRRRGRRGRVA